MLVAVITLLITQFILYRLTKSAFFTHHYDLYHSTHFKLISSFQFIYYSLDIHLIKLASTHKLWTIQLTGDLFTNITSNENMKWVFKNEFNDIRYSSHKIWVKKLILLMCDIGRSTNMYNMSWVISIVITAMSTITHR